MIASAITSTMTSATVSTALVSSFIIGEIWLEPGIVNLLRGPGESMSDAILKLVELEAQTGR